jgi:hypothetical protein
MDKESVTIIYKVYIKLKLFLLYITLIASYFYYKTKPSTVKSFTKHTRCLLSLGLWICSQGWNLSGLYKLLSALVVMCVYEACKDNFYLFIYLFVILHELSFDLIESIIDGFLVKWNRAFLELLQKANITCTSLSYCLYGFSPKALGHLSFI